MTDQTPVSTTAKVVAGEISETTTGKTDISVTTEFQGNFLNFCHEGSCDNWNMKGSYHTQTEPTGLSILNIQVSVNSPDFFDRD
jgi:hypothetical protein